MRDTGNRGLHPLVLIRSEVKLGVVRAGVVVRPGLSLFDFPSSEATRFKSMMCKFKACRGSITFLDFSRNLAVSPSTVLDSNLTSTGWRLANGFCGDTFIIETQIVSYLLSRPVVERSVFTLTLVDLRTLKYRDFSLTFTALASSSFSGSSGRDAGISGQASIFSGNVGCVHRFVI